MDYKLYQFDLIEKFHKEFLYDCKLLNNLLVNEDFKEQIKKGEDLTWLYPHYNVFYHTSNNFLFYELFKYLVFCIKDFIKPTKPIWMQCWLNYHEGNKVTEIIGEKKGFHSHSLDYHGYVSIDPQDTTTIFKNNLKIKNKIGQIYLGPGQNIDKNGGWEHYVKINSPYTTPRITLGFDITYGLLHNNKHYVPTPSFIPII